MRGHAIRVSRHGQPRRLTAKDTARGGFTLIELSIAISILLIGMVAVVSATSRMHALRKHSREMTIAQNALRSMGERIHARSYDLKTFDESTWAQRLTATYAAGGAYGNAFDVTGINVR